VGESEARAYLRNLAALHVSPLLFAGGMVAGAAGVAELAGPLLVVGFIGWGATLTAAHVRAARRHRGKPLFGGDSIAADANWWIGWGPIDEAAAATSQDPKRLRSLAKRALILTVLLFVAVFPAAALRNLG
jgi:hypothetical protein